VQQFSAPPRQVLFTVLLDNYEDLNELKYDDHSVRAICFTDSPNIKSSTWELVRVDPMFPCDPIRSQRMLKILGHPMLLAFDEWLYIDNTVRLLQSPSKILGEILKEHDLAIPSHSFRTSLRDEFAVVKESRLDSHEVLDEQLSHYEATYPSSLANRPLWTGIFARRPTLSILAWSDTWAKHVLRYSRRDQLSVNVALEINNINFNRIELDNYSSDFHEWPIHNNRKDSKRVHYGPNYGVHAAYLYSEILQLNEQAQMIRHHFTNSTSWRITAPLRAVSLAWKRFHR
jgi:hypothetical protein